MVPERRRAPQELMARLGPPALRAQPELPVPMARRCCGALGARLRIVTSGDPGEPGAAGAAGADGEGGGVWAGAAWAMTSRATTVASTLDTRIVTLRTHYNGWIMTQRWMPIA